MRKTVVLCCVFALLCGGLFANPAAESQSQQTRIIVDHDGDEVEIPEKIERLVILQPWPLPSIATVFLGGTDRIVGVPPAAIGAAKAGILGELFPSFLDISSSFSPDGVTINQEELLALNPDAVIVFAGKDHQKQAVRDAGIPAISVSVNKWGYDNLRTYDEWIDILSRIFPEEAKVDRVSAYSKSMEDMILSRVSSVPEEQRTRILFLFRCDDKTIVTSGKLFFGQKWCDEIGAVNVAETVAQENQAAVVNMEQIYEWDPDLIFITNFTPTVADDLYLNRQTGRDWSPVKAVKERRVFKMPLGTYRSYTPSTDTPVTLLWMAKKAYPELFADLDLVEEVKKYYKDMYSITLTDEQVNRIYNQDAEGSAGTF